MVAQNKSHRVDLKNRRGFISTLSHPDIIYAETTLTGKREIMSSIFPEKLCFDGKVNCFQFSFKPNSAIIQTISMKSAEGTAVEVSLIIYLLNSKKRFKFSFFHKKVKGRANYSSIQ